MWWAATHPAFYSLVLMIPVRLAQFFYAAYRHPWRYGVMRSWAKSLSRPRLRFHGISLGPHRLRHTHIYKFHERTHTHKNTNHVMYMPLGFCKHPHFSSRQTGHHNTKFSPSSSFTASVSLLAPVVFVLLLSFGLPHLPSDSAVSLQLIVDQVSILYKEISVQCCTECETTWITNLFKQSG